MADCPQTWEIYLYGTLAVIIISSLSMIGALAIPLIRKKFYEYGMLFFMALAIGTLAGDAILHLIPAALGAHAHGSEMCLKSNITIDLHPLEHGSSSDGHDSHHGSHEGVPTEPPGGISDDHDHDGHEEGHSHESDNHDGNMTIVPVERRRKRQNSEEHDHDSHDESGEHGSHESHEGHDDHDEEEGGHKNLWLMSAVIGSIYVFFLFESLMHSLAHKLSMDSGESMEANFVPLGSFRYRNKKTQSRAQIIDPAELATDEVRPAWNGNDANGNGYFSGTYEKKPVQTRPIELQQVSVRLSEDDPQDMPNKRETRICGIKPVAFMVLIGDAIHNFADGVAIGATFSGGLSGGLSSTIAIACHEIPHELGDFAVLLNSGLSVCKALLFNFISALTCIAGLYVGIALGQMEEVRQWLFAVVAGMFLYVALVDMVHEIHELNIPNKKLGYVIESLGLLIGFGILLLLGYYEDQIKL